MLDWNYFLVEYWIFFVSGFEVFYYKLVHKAKGHTVDKCAETIQGQKLYEEIRYLNFCLKEVKGNLVNI